jgi:hypothetical protein
MRTPIRDRVVLERVTWKAPALAVFHAMQAAIEADVGPPTARDLDSNGLGLFDAHCLRFGCGLEVVLWRYHLGRELCPLDPAVEPSSYEVYADQPDLEHVACHLGVPLERMRLWTDPHDQPIAAPRPRTVAVMRTDDNANDVEMTRVTSRCEAEALVQTYESRGHKQSYWITSVAPPSD